MNRSRLLALFLLVAMRVSAVVDSVFLITPDVLEQNNIYWGLANPTKLIFNEFSRFNTAQMQFKNDQGAYHNVNASGHRDSYAIGALSYLKKGNFYLRGSAGFEFVNRRNISWSSSMMNNEYLIGIGDSISGLQRGERYLLGAEVGCKINSIWSVGIGLDYLAFTNNKQVDPRNGNKGICIQMNPGFMYTGGCIQVGATLLYHYANEDVSYMKDGDREQDVFSIFPLWFYKSESLQKGGLRRYYDRSYIGGALLLGNADFTRLTQYAIELKGGKETQSIFHNKVMDERGGETEGFFLAANGRIQSKFESLHHNLRVNLKSSHLNGFDNIQQLAVVDGVTKWVQHGRVKKSEIVDKDLGFSYSLAKPASKWMNSGEVGVFGHLSNTNKYYLIYPLQYKQNYSQYLIGSFCKKNKEFDKSVLNLSVSLHTQFGGGNPLRKEMLEDQEVPEITLKQDLNNLTREFDYNTATSWNVNLYGRYLYQLNRDVAVFGSCSAFFKQVTTTSYKGNRHLALDLSLGIVF
ncbi:MAG: DUF6850 family outer membrane beta-barrel protein [Tannerellaceae bacterium]